MSRIGKEFANREQAEDYISGQDTSSETCSQKKQNRMKHDHWKEQIHELLYIDFDGVKPPVTFGQVNSWWNTFDFIERLKKNYPDTKFWHPWHFDWRGRIMPVSTMLSPQNDDFARGLITHSLTPSKYLKLGGNGLAELLQECIEVNRFLTQSKEIKEQLWKD